MDYQFLKALHFLGIIVFLGNIIVTAIWKALADSTKKPDVISYAQRLVTITDYSFTATGAALIVISGRLMASTKVSQFLKRQNPLYMRVFVLAGFALYIANPN